MTPEKDERRASGGSLSKFFRALTRRGTGDSVSKRLSFSPTKDEAQTHADISGESTVSLDVEGSLQKSEEDAALEQERPSDVGVPEEKRTSPERESVSLEEGEVIPTTTSPVESGLQSETSPEDKVKAPKIRGREVKSRFLNSIFTSKDKPARAGSVPRRAPSAEPKRPTREASLGPQSKKQVASSPKAKAAAFGRSGSASRRRSGTSEHAEGRVRPAASKEVRGSTDGHPKAKQGQRRSIEGSTRPVESSANGEGKRLSGGKGNVGAFIKKELSKVQDGQDRKPETKSVSERGHEVDSKRPEEAVLEAVRDRLSLLDIVGFEGEAITGETAANGDEDRRKERAESGEAASTREGVALRRTSSSAKRKSGGGEASANRKSWTGSAANGSIGNVAKEKHSDRLAKWQELKGTWGRKVEEPKVGQDSKPRSRRPSQLLLALRDQSKEEPLQAEESTSSIVSNQKASANEEPPSGSPSTTERKARGIVVPSRVWLDSSKKNEPTADNPKSKNEVNDPVSRLEPKDTRLGIDPGLGSKPSVSAPQRAPFTKLSEAGHWLPSSPQRNLKPSRSAATSNASTPSESRAATPSATRRGTVIEADHKTLKPSRSDASTPSESRAATPSATRRVTVSAPASPSQTARNISRRNSGSAPASPKQPRAGSRTKMRPLGGQEEGAGKTVASPVGKGAQKASAANEVRKVRVLHNRWLQWCFVNAKARVTQEAQQRTAEASLYSAWHATSALRTSVAAQKTQLHRERHGRKLDALLAAQTPGLERWQSLEHEHRASLVGTVEALEATMLRVPLINGASVDPPRLQSALADARQVVSMTEPTVHAMLPKAAKAEALLSQLAETAAQERALLRECRDLLAHAATLEVEERSLRAHLIQLNRERELGRPMPVMATPMRQPTF